MNTLMSLLMMLMVFVIGVGAGLSLSPQAIESSPGLSGAVVAQLPCMDTTGFTTTTVSTDSSNIYLTSGCYSLPISSNEIQTYSINTGLSGERNDRPTTHDSIQDIIEIFGIEPLIVKIERMEAGIYFAKLSMMLGNRVLDMDIRPSDAVAIAVRTDTPIYVNETLLVENGEYIC